MIGQIVNQKTGKWLVNYAFLSVKTASGLKIWLLGWVSCYVAPMLPFGRFANACHLDYFVSAKVLSANLSSWISIENWKMDTEGKNTFSLL